MFGVELCIAPICPVYDVCGQKPFTDSKLVGPEYIFPKFHFQISIHIVNSIQRNDLHPSLT